MKSRHFWLLVLESIQLAGVAIMLNSASVAGQAKNDAGTPKPFQDPQQELWSRDTLADKSDGTGEPEPGAQAKPFLETALADARKKPDTPCMSGAVPVAVNGLVFYRSYAGITAVYLRKIRDQIGNLKEEPGYIHWRSTPFEGALGEMFFSQTMRGPLESWINNIYKSSGFMNLLYENSTVGTLTTDNRNIYAVDDLALPIPPKYLLPQFWSNGIYVHDDLKRLVKQNRLKAFNLASGKIEWELRGGYSSWELADNSKAIVDYSESHFLCAPISVGGKLYVLNEKNSGEVRLLGLDPATGKLSGTPLILGTVKSERLYFADIARRANAIRLAYVGGILVCPTHAGEVFGVDVAKHTVRWICTYQPVSLPAPAPEKITLRTGWKFPAPHIRDGKLVFTAADDDHVHCLDVQEGKMLWKIKQEEDDLYVAGITGGKVLVVGNLGIRALALKDGKELWKLEIGQSSGRGVLNRNAYLLPLKTGATSKQPEIAYVDVDQGRLLGTSPLANAPGNLTLYQELILSQSPTGVTAYGK